MGRADFLALGSWNALCDRCGGKFKAYDLKIDWQGLYLCQRCWEPRHPQDFVRGIQDVQTPPWTRPPSADTFVDVGCTPNNRTDIVGYAVVGCAIVGFVDPAFDPLVGTNV